MADVPFGFVGQEYTAEDPYQDRQVLLNWFVEIDPNDSAKEPKALLGTPGLFQIATVVPAIAASWTADTTIFTVDTTIYTADGSS